MSVDGLAGVWRDRLLRCEASDLTVAEFRARERVVVNTYYYWKRKLEDANRNVSAPLFVAARWKDSTANDGREGNALSSPKVIDDARARSEPIWLEGSAVTRSRIDSSMEESIRIDLPNGAVGATRRQEPRAALMGHESAKTDGKSRFRRQTKKNSPICRRNCLPWNSLRRKPCCLSSWRCMP